MIIHTHMCVCVCVCVRVYIQASTDTLSCESSLFKTSETGVVYMHVCLQVT